MQAFVQQISAANRVDLIVYRAGVEALQLLQRQPSASLMAAFRRGETPGSSNTPGGFLSPAPTEEQLRTVTVQRNAAGRLGFELRGPNQVMYVMGFSQGVIDRVILIM